MSSKLSKELASGELWHPAWQAPAPGGVRRPAQAACEHRAGGFSEDKSHVPYECRVCTAHLD